jgi:hypothetical protein
MRIRMNVSATGIGLFLAAAISLSAHHSFTAEFDANQPVTLHGTVTKFEFINPHTWIHMDVKDKDGNVANWAIEGGTPNILIRKGLNKSSLPVGSEIIVEGYRAKDGETRANGREVTFSDGRKILLGGSTPTEPGQK